MKRIALILLVCCGVASCIQMTRVDYSSFIQRYNSYSSVLTVEQFQSISHEPLSLAVSINPCAPSYSIISEGDDKDKFDALCIQNGDCSYPNTVKYLSGAGAMDLISCVTPDFIRIDVIADKDFDKEHPAGTSLADLVYAYMDCYRRFVDSGYDKSLEGKKLYKRLDQIEEEDISLCTGYYQLFFNVLPDDPSSEMTITVISENAAGKTQTGSAKCKFNINNLK